MKYIQVASLNPKIVEQLEETHKRVRYEEPEFSHHDQIKEYVDSLRYEDEHVRESKIIQWISPILNQTLNLWRTKYSVNSELIENARREKIELENKKKQISRRIGEIDYEIENKRSEIEIKKQEKIEYNRKELSSLNIDLDAERLKVTLLLLFSIIVALGTFVYFANSQSSIYWSTMPAPEKVGLVKTFILNGSQTHINAFEIEIPKNRDLALSDLEDVDRSSINQAPKPNLLQYFSTDPSAIFLAAGAFMLILMGKITAIVYEKLNSPNWMFFFIFILSIIVLIGAIISMATVTKKTVYMNLLRDEITETESSIKRIKDSSFDYGSTLFGKEKKETPELKRLENKLNEQKDQYNKTQNSFGIYKFFSLLMFMFTELLIGSLAWITHGEYIIKKIQIKTGTKGSIAIIDQEIKSDENYIHELLDEKNHLEESQNIASDLMHRLNAMLSDIVSKEKIEHLAQDFMDREIEFAKQILQKAKYEWVKDSN